MNHEQYVEAVSRGEYPHDPVVPPRADNFTSPAGFIRNLLFAPVQSVALITSIAGAIRSNHAHKSDWHFLHVISGRMYYFWRDTNGQRCFIDVAPGETVFTPPLVAHATLFPFPTTIISMARNIRRHEDHEADVVRVELLDRATADELLAEWT
jgi:quercetin dioxygenase-like cupin family protein